MGRLVIGDGFTINMHVSGSSLHIIPETGERMVISSSGIIFNSGSSKETFLSAQKGLVSIFSGSSKGEISASTVIAKTGKFESGTVFIGNTVLKTTEEDTFMISSSAGSGDFETIFSGSSIVFNKGTTRETILKADRGLLSIFSGSSKGEISASKMVAQTGRFEGETLYIGGEAINKTLVQNLKRGYSSIGLSPVGRTNFTGNISASGTIFADNVGYYTQEFIPISPLDFTSDNNSNGRYDAYTDTTGGSSKNANASTNYMIVKFIPKGYTAVSASLFGSETGNSAMFYSSSISVGTSKLIVSLTTKVEASSGTGSAFTNGVVGDGETYVIALWDPDDIGDEIYGGKIYIQPT